MGFKDIDCKLGNMRKVQNWTLCPQDSNKPDEIIIQCDNRIALVQMAQKKALLSDGKGGHPGFHKLSRQLGAKVIDVPEETIKELRRLTGTNTEGDGIGTVILAAS